MARWPEEIRIVDVARFPSAEALPPLENYATIIRRISRIPKSVLLTNVASSTASRTGFAAEFRKADPPQEL